MKTISNNRQIKKRFGVSELLRYEDKIHFKELYNFDNQILDQFTLPEERREKERYELEKIDKFKQQSSTPKHNPNAISFNKANEDEELEKMDMMENFKTEGDNEEEEV